MLSGKLSKIGISIMAFYIHPRPCIKQRDFTVSGHTLSPLTTLVFSIKCICWRLFSCASKGVEHQESVLYKV